MNFGTVDCAVHSGSNFSVKYVIQMLKYDHSHERH